MAAATTEEHLLGDGSSGIGAEVAPDRTMTFGRYALRERLARGGMAAVYLAQTRGPDGFRKWVALKTILPGLADREDFVKMFLDEARLAARLSHPNVCAVFDFGEEQGAYYLAMEFLQGAPLNKLTSTLRRRHEKLDHALAARIVADAARGLHAAHELRGPDGRCAEVVHRDVSPQNIFVLFDGIAKVVDFGIARSRDRLAEETRAGITKGKPAYMSPEQLSGRGEAVDRRTDVFALGIVLWELAVGARLFRRDNDLATMFALLNEPIPDPRESDPEFSPLLAAIIMKALARDLAERYQTADELARALDEYIASTGRPAGAAQLADLMQRLFGPEITDRQTQLARWDADTLATEVSVSSASGANPRREPLPSAYPPADAPGTQHFVAPAPASRPSRGALLGLGLAGLALFSVAGGVALSARSRGGDGAPSLAPSASSALRASSASALPSAPASAAPTAPASAAPSASSEAAAPVATAAPAGSVAPVASAPRPLGSVRPRGAPSARGEPAAPAEARTEPRAGPRAAPTARPRATGLMTGYDDE